MEKMWHYPQIDPVAITLGPFNIHWYAISYLAAIFLCWRVMLYRAAWSKPAWSEEQISDLIFYGVLGVILGGRMGYMLFYGFDNLLANPLTLFKVWQGGMSFHGGLLGVIIAGLYFAYRQGRSFLAVTDFVAPAIPLGLGCGRIGNFINAELPGRITDLPWALVYPGETIARHPSSLYQACLEGPILFIVIWLLAGRNQKTGFISGVFLIAYGLLRFVSEFFRAPDSHMGFVALGWMSQGQLLSIPMLLTGALVVWLVLADRIGNRNQ
jgi:phosphatidylglycerol:prolipoprotein diacylglycerol transferase